MTQPHNTHQKAEQKHTPLPWHVTDSWKLTPAKVGRDARAIYINPEIMASSIATIGIIGAENIEAQNIVLADAAFIVTACNSHYALLNVARAIHDTYFSGNPETFHTRLNENAGGDFAKILMVAIDSVTNGGGNG